MSARTTIRVELTEDADGATLSVELVDGMAEIDRVEGNLPVRVSMEDLEEFANLLYAFVRHHRPEETRVLGVVGEHADPVPHDAGPAGP